jgi:hypothetical protein
VKHQRQSDVLTGEQFLAECARLKAQGKRIWRVDRVGNAGYRVSGITSPPNQLEFDLPEMAATSGKYLERASRTTADKWFEKMHTLTNGGKA